MVLCLVTRWRTAWLSVWSPDGVHRSSLSGHQVVYIMVPCLVTRWRTSWFSVWSPGGVRHGSLSGHQVVYIVERVHSRVATGRINLMKDRNADMVLFSPVDHRLPRIRVPMADCPQGMHAAQSFLLHFFRKYPFLIFSSIKRSIKRSCIYDQYLSRQNSLFHMLNKRMWQQ